MVETRSELWKRIKTYYNSAKYGNEKSYRSLSTKDMKKELDRLYKQKQLRNYTPFAPKKPSLNQLIFLAKNEHPNFMLKKGESVKSMLKRYNTQYTKEFFTKPENKTKLTINAKLLTSDIVRQIPMRHNLLLSATISQRTFVDNKVSGTKEVSHIFDNIDEIGNILDYSKSSELRNYMIEQSVGSDIQEIVGAIQQGDKITFRWFKHEPKKQTNSGAYFAYFNMIEELDLSRYQIFHEDSSDFDFDENMKDKEMAQRELSLRNEECIIYSLRMAGVDEQKIKTLYSCIFDRKVKVKDLKKVSEIVDCSFVVKTDDKYHGDYKIGQGAMNINLALVEGHYFINEQTDITKEAIDYFEKYHDHKSYPTIRKINKRGKTLMSFHVVKRLVENFKSGSACLKPLLLKNITQGHYGHINVKDDMILTEEGIQARPYTLNDMNSVFHAGEKPLDYDVWFFDTETFVNEKGNHEAIMVSFIQYKHMNSDTLKPIKKTMQTRHGSDCMKEFLTSVALYSTGKRALLIAHNLMFDFSTLLTELEGFESVIQTGSMLKSVKAVYKPDDSVINEQSQWGKYMLEHYDAKIYKQSYNKLTKFGCQIVLKDSYAFLQAKLCKLPSMLGLKCGDKEAYPYTLLSPKTLYEYIDIKQVYQHLDSDELRKTLTDNALKIGALDFSNEECMDLNMLKYTRHYCEQDVRILSEAYMKFRELVIEATNLDILNFMSAPQLASRYFLEQGVFDGCYEVCGMAQTFLRKAIVGGRCMLNRNEKQHVVNVDYYNKSSRYIPKGANIEVINDKVQDFDAVGLYPSAMNRLQGFIQGQPKLMQSSSLCHVDTVNDLPKFDYYVADIKITSIGIERDFPLLSIVDENGVRNFNNDIVGKTITVDKTTMEDIIEFQHMTFDIIQGLYYDEGFNSKIRTIINDMKNKRDVEKSKPNGGCQIVWKLLMNSSYGKLIQKPITVDKRFFKGDEIDVILNQSIAPFIKSLTEIDDKFYTADIQRSVVNHYASPHLGGQVLSMSKRIMNEVMCLAEDLGLKMYYQDTDSIHIKQHDIEILSQEYDKKYGRKLIGKGMGQFHSDFEVKGVDKEISSVEFIGVAKKVYIDHLVWDGGEDYHIRVKGIPTQCLKDKSDDYMKTYNEFMYDGGKHKFEMDKYCPLKRGKDYRFVNNKGMARELSF